MTADRGRGGEPRRGGKKRGENRLFASDLPCSPPLFFFHFCLCPPSLTHPLTHNSPLLLSPSLSPRRPTKFAVPFKGEILKMTRPRVNTHRGGRREVLWSRYINAAITGGEAQSGTYFYLFEFPHCGFDPMSLLNHRLKLVFQVMGH